MKLAMLVLFAGMAAYAGPPVTLASFPNSVVYAIQSDAAGNLYVAGLRGGYITGSPFVAKLNSSGDPLYDIVLGGSKFGIAWAIAVDAAGNCYVYGNTNSSDFPTTSGALQTTALGSFQGFVSKLDPRGKILYSTFVGGATDVTPGLTSAPVLNSIVVDAQGDAIITGQAGTNAMTGTFPPAPAPVISSSEAFVVKLDPTGSKILAGIAGVGGLIALDADDNVYVAGIQYSVTAPPPLTATTGAFQTEPDVCNLLGGFPSSICEYQYVVKLNSGLNQVLYATYVSGTFSEVPAAISVNAEGNVTVAGTTYSLDYPTTAGAYEPVDLASAAQNPSCFYIINCIVAPTPSGYVTTLNSTGTGLINSTYFSGTQTDTINFASFAPDAIYLSGRASSADLPGLTGVPEQCLPQSYETRLSADASQVGRTRIIRGAILAYDGFAGMLLATTGTDVIAIDPNAPASPVACVLDAADLKPVTTVAPGELVSLFGEFGAGSPAVPYQALSATTLDGVSVDVNGTPSPLLYVSGSQVNFQIPASVASATQASIQITSSAAGINTSQTLSVAASNPTAFLNVAAPPPDLATCNMEDSATLSGLLPLALNPGGSVNSCLNPAPAGSNVTLFLNGVGATTAPTVTTNTGKVISAFPLPNAVSGLWEVVVQTPSDAMSGGLQISLSVSGVPVRDTSLVIWVK